VPSIEFTAVDRLAEAQIALDHRPEIHEQKLTIANAKIQVGRAKIDELPQLVNILLGQMSFVGHRPEIPHRVEKLRDDLKPYYYKFKPGLTSPAALKFFHQEKILEKKLRESGYKDPEKFYIEVVLPEKILLNKKYYENPNLLADLKLIFQTIFKLAKEFLKYED